MLTQTVLLCPPATSLKAALHQAALHQPATQKAASVQAPSAQKSGAASILSAGGSPLIPAQVGTGAAPAQVRTQAVAALDAPALAGTRGLRLTRRGRLVFIGLPLMLTAAAALALLGFFTAPAMASSGSPELTRTVQVSVVEGESLWELAQDFAPDRDPRDVVADIMELNNLSDARIPVGAQLFIPVEG